MRWPHRRARAHSYAARPSIHTRPNRDRLIAAPRPWGVGVGVGRFSVNFSLHASLRSDRAPITAATAEGDRLKQQHAL